MKQLRRARYASVVFDADSTLASIEGIDWLGAQRGENVARVVEALTVRAMAGDIALEEVYALRLDTIQPSRLDIVALSEAYVAAIEPGAAQLIAELRRARVDIVIVSGGLRDALLPLATALNLPHNKVHAVDLQFDTQGRFHSLAGLQPLSRQDGKPRVVRALHLARPSVMIGDGSTDAAVRGETDAFIAYTRVARRPVVVASADAEAQDFDQLTTLLFDT